MGDFNTVPHHVTTQTTLTVIDPKYPTHINPVAQIGVYDMAVYRHFNNEKIDAELLDESELSEDSKAYVKALINSRVE